MPARSIHYALSLGGTLCAGALGLAAYTTRALNSAPRRPHDEYMLSPWELQIDFETVRFVTADGVGLSGWWLDRPAARTTVIVLSGRRGMKHQFLGIGAALWRAGHNVLLFDYRACGQSECARSSLAYHELHDVQAAIVYARQRLPDAGIGLLGYSMGASLAILATAAEPRIQSVVADSPFATMRDVIASTYRNYHLPARPLLDLADALSGWCYGYSFDAVRPLDVIDRIAPRPLLLIHGAQDRTIPVDHAHRLYAAAGSGADLRIIDGAQHCGGYYLDRAGYIHDVTDFFAATLAAPASVSVGG
ncbi:MAG TPA: alpha/beta fold hydrolase [Herpetosiphonaceae bacterium]